MRPYKHPSSDAAKIFTPTTNYYRLQLTTVNSLIPKRQLPRQFDARFCKDVTRDIFGDNLKVNTAKSETKHAAHSVSATQHATVLPFPFTGPERTLVSTTSSASAACTGTTADPGPAAHRSKASRALAHSAGSACVQSTVRSPQPIGETTQTQGALCPSFPHAFCSRDAWAFSSARLDLDRRGLQDCPLLEGGESLLMLNLQHNLISQIQNMSHLQRLVFLDLYDNCVADMSGISALTCLRVLILGRNRIKKICSLDTLTKLDVLDLHGNQITKIENLTHLSELRILNLAGNSISRVANLQGLDSLTELNLQQNSISSMTEVDRLPCLQRLFLSHNNIASFDDLACVCQSSSVAELTLDGNPIAQETGYRHTALSSMLQLTQLDTKRITEEERRLACIVVRKDEEKRRESHKQAMQKEKRRLAIQNAARCWEDLRACVVQTMCNRSGEVGSAQCLDELRQLPSCNVLEQPAEVSGTSQLSPSHACSPQEVRDLEPTGPIAQNLCLSDNHVAELVRDTLCLFGPGALEALDRSWGAHAPGTITTIAFRYIPFDAIVPSLSRIRMKFPNLLHLMFLETGISHLLQLAALAQVRRLEQLTIQPQGNPVTGMVLWRPFLIYRLYPYHLQKINGLQVVMGDVVCAERLFGTLGHMAATKTPRYRMMLLLEDPRKHQLQLIPERRGRRAGLSLEAQQEMSRKRYESLGKALLKYPSWEPSTEGIEGGAVESRERATEAQQYLRKLVRKVCDSSLKGELLHRLWPSLLVEMVRDCVLQMRDRAAYRQACLHSLSHSPST